MLTGDTMKSAIVSDLFFNSDLSDVKQYEGGQFAGFDEAALLLRATELRDSISRLTDGAVTFEPAALVADFHKRL